MTETSPQWPEPTGYPPTQQPQRPMQISPAMRAATVDRERAIDVLRAGFAEGRLTQDEFNNRMARAHTARTYGELAGLTSDLPAGPLPIPVPPPWQAQAPAPAWQPAPRTAETNPMATAALVLGLLEFVTMGITAIPAIICGHMARAQIRRTGEQGDGMAVTGLALGYVAIGFATFLALLALVAFSHGAAANPGPFGG